MSLRPSAMQPPVTSSWATKLPEAYARIGISRGPPRGQRGYRVFGPLAPGAWFKSVPDGKFVELYMAQLEKLDPAAVLADLAELADGRIPALLCFERPPPDQAWCHRGLVAGWLHDATGLEVGEYGHEECGYGWAHPKLLAPLRRSG
jgi:Protein of unknown function, DUF488